MARPSLVTASTLQGIAELGAAQPAAARGGTAAQIHATLRTAIVNGQLAPGAALNESDVASQFGVSRTPVREAFRSLAGEGLIDVLPQKGTFVSRLHRAQLRDALFVREALECAAVRLAAQAPEAQRAALLRVVDRQRDALAHGEAEASLQADEDLHRGIMELSGHALAWAVVNQARTHLERLRRIANSTLRGSEEALLHHERIARAVAEGDAAAAEVLLRTHIRQVEGFIDRIAERFADYVD